MSVDRSVRFVQQALRRVLVILEAKVEKKIDEALNQDIIEPVRDLSA